MILTHIYVASLIVAFAVWYLCLAIPNRWVRAVVRSTVVAVLCAPGILVGHGVSVGPMLFALSVQPFIFNFLSILIVWVIVLVLILSTPALRKDDNEWPPSAKQVFLGFYPGKMGFFGLTAALLFLALNESSVWRSAWVWAAKYLLYFSAAALHYALCYSAARRKKAHPFIAPLYFTVPIVFVAAPTVALLWYGAGVVGGLSGRGRSDSASWLALGVFGLLCANSLLMGFQAINAPPHVKFTGGAAVNGTMAAVFAALAFASWWWLRRRAEEVAPTVKAIRKKASA